MSAPAEVNHALLVSTLGWIGQACFSARILVQWLASERAGTPVAPRMFWWLSAAGAALLSAYSVLRGEAVMVPGFVITFFVYLRNLQLSATTPSRPRSGWVVPVLAAGLLISICPYAREVFEDGLRSAPDLGWQSVALAGQILWIGRFLMQWRHSELSGRSEFPPSFWWMSLAGSGLLLAYGLHRDDPVFVWGFLLSWAAPIRNLTLHHRRAANWSR